MSKRQYTAPKWKKRIRKHLINRYGSRCTFCFCKAKGRKLTIHHIKPVSKYPKLKKVIENCILLCIECHVEHHKISGDEVMNHEEPIKIAKASIEDLRRLKAKMEDNFALCSFMGKTEKEYMVACTIHAAVNNFDDPERKEAYSVRGNVFCNTDNTQSYNFLRERGYFHEEARDDKIVIFVTQKLVDALDAFFDKGTTIPHTEPCRRRWRI